MILREFGILGFLLCEYGFDLFLASMVGIVSCEFVSESSISCDYGHLLASLDCEP